MAKKNKQIQTIMLDLYRKCVGNAAREAMYQRVYNEFNKISIVETKVKDPQAQRINKLLHATRALETGLETFLDLYGLVPTQLKYHTMGSYMKKLQTPPSGRNTFSKISSHMFAKGFSNDDSIRNKRNKYLHQADQYPTPQETKVFLDEIYKFYAAVLSLA